MRNTLPVLCLLATSVAAQGMPQTGKFAGVPFGLIWELDGASHTSELFARWYGTPGPYITMPAGTASHPGFQTAMLQQAIKNATGLANVPGIAIDGFSTWNDQVPMVWVDDTRGFETRTGGGTNEQWGVIFMNGSNNETYAPPSILATQQSRLPNIGSEVLGFYVDTTSIPAWITGESYLEMSREFLSAPPPGPQLAAIDLAMPHIVLWNGQTPAPSEMRVLDRIAFSVTNQFVTDLKTMNPNQAVEIDNTPLYGTSIIAAKWNPTTLKWGDLTILADHNDFGLTVADDVDAVAISKLPSGMPGPTNILTRVKTVGLVNYYYDYILFSHVERGASNPQLMVHASVNTSSGSSSRTGALHHDPNGPTITDASGIRPGEDIKAVCAGDPEGVYHGRLWGMSGHDTPNRGFPPNEPQTFIVSTACEREVDSGKSWVHLFASGRRNVDTAVVLFLGDNATNPLEYWDKTNQLFGGMWLKKVDMFSLRLPTIDGLDLDLKVWRGVPSDNPQPEWSAWNRLRTR